MKAPDASTTSSGDSTVKTAKPYSLFKKRKQPEPEIFDESSFDFKLQGGPYQTSLIIATATLKKGNKDPLPLHCTWYRSSREADFVEIEEITGAFYQPNADDVGCKICVHAMPLTDTIEYTGMPAFAEVGPLQLDPAIKRGVQECLANGATFPVTVLSGLEGASGPTVLLISLSSDACVIADEMLIPLHSYPVTNTFPTVLINCKSSCLFSLLPNESTRIEVSCSDATYRDTIALTARMLCGAKFAKDRSDLFLQLQQLNSSLTKTHKDKDALATKFTALKQALEEAQKDRSELEGKLAEAQEELVRQRGVANDRGSELETTRQEEKFLRQDLNVYKNRCAALEGEQDRIKDSLRKLVEVSAKSSSQLSEVAKGLQGDEQSLILSRSLSTILAALKLGSTHDRSSKRDTGDHIFIAGHESLPTLTSDENSADNADEEDETLDNAQDRQTAEINDIKADLASKAKECDSLKVIVSEVQDKLLAEKNFYKKKIESLAHENDKLLKKLSKLSEDFSGLEQAKLDFEGERRKLVKERDIAQAQANFCLALMESTETKLFEETKRNEELRLLACGRPKAESKEFHHIINSMTRTLTEREAELQTQKLANKTLLDRIAELQSQSF